MKVPAAFYALLLAGTAGACTSFVDFSSASPWYGMNFDWHPQMEILFRIESAEDGTRVFTMSFVTEQGPVPTLGVTQGGRFCNMQVTDAPWTGPEPSEELGDFRQVESQSLRSVGHGHPDYFLTASRFSRIAPRIPWGANRITPM